MEKDKLEKDKEISVIIPTLNEEENIFNVISNMPKNVIDEIIVVDGFSTDDTIRKAMRAGADKIILQKGKGKGSALKTGIEKAKGDIIVFWDADIKNTTPKMVYKLIEPILNKNCEFVKANYSKTPGRVSTLVAKPLLKAFFPEIEFGHPLAGEVAFKKDIITNIELQPNFGIEIGMLIDVVMNNYKTKEIDLKIKEHDHKPLNELMNMSEEIIKVIFKKACEYRRLNTHNLEYLSTFLIDVIK